jgi:hypothetical protein
MSHVEKKTVQIGIERSEFRSFGRSLEKKIHFHPFWDKQKSWAIWDCDQEWRSIILSTSLFKMLKTSSNKTSQ